MSEMDGLDCPCPRSVPHAPRRDQGLVGLVVLVSSLSAACATTRSNTSGQPRAATRTADRTATRTADRNTDRAEDAAPSRHGPARADVMIGLASWYGREQQGGPTASGERFNMRDLTAAHRRLPFGTRVRVTNLRNGKSVTVRINDRGPYGRGRIIDLSRAAAQALDMIEAGVVRVRVEVLTGAPGS